MATPIELAVQMALYDERNAIVEWLTSKRDSYAANAESYRNNGVAIRGAINAQVADAYQCALDYVNGRRETVPQKPVPPSCYRCNGTGSITYFGEGADDGHDIDLNCPVCNPKYPPHDDDRDWYNDY